MSLTPQDQRSCIEDDAKDVSKANMRQSFGLTWMKQNGKFISTSCAIAASATNPTANMTQPFADRTFIIPALLPEASNAKTAWGNSRADDWQLDIEYPFLHRSIIERIILRFGETYRANRGALAFSATPNDGQVLLECEYGTNNNPPKGNSVSTYAATSLTPLVYALRKLVKRNQPTPPLSGIPATRPNQREIAFPEFKETEEKFSSRLDPIEPTKTLKLFISYSRADRDHKLTLEKHLRLIKEALKHQVKLDIWSDHLMDAGEGVNDQILPELRSADLILLLVSPDFLDPERYSRGVELPIALERYKKEGTPVAPIIIRHTENWNERLGHLTVPTTENADPLEDWPSTDKFWGSVDKTASADKSKSSCKHEQTTPKTRHMATAGRAYC